MASLNLTFNIGGTVYPDGSSNAPAGTAQFPTLLNKYAHRAPWKVAGVDYHVGIDRTKYPTNANLKTPSSANMPPGCSLSGNTVFVDGTGGVANGIVLDGFNFGSSFGLQVTAGNSPTIQNCYFAVNAFACQYINNQQGATTAVGGIVQNCEFNQTQSPAWIAPILVISNASDATNPHIIRYNLFTNSQSEHFQIHDGFSNGHVTQLYFYNKYNVFHVAGAGAPVGAHGDWTHTWGDNMTYCENSFNLYLQDVSGSVAATRGIVDVSEQSRADNLYIKNNTLINVAGSNVQQYASIIGAMIKNLAQVYNNYCDPSGVMGLGHWFLDTYTTGTNYPANAGRADLQGNINMNDGSSINS